LIEFIPEMHLLLGEMNEILAKNPGTSHAEIGEKLSAGARAVFDMLPSEIRQQMMADRDPHGNVQVSKIETERLLISVVTDELKKRAADGKYIGKFAALPQFYGYEGRSCEPSNFDSNYCYTLGHTIGALIELGKTGLLAVVRNLTGKVREWQPAGIPVTRMLHIERRKGKEVPVIKKALVELDGAPFKFYLDQRLKWTVEDHYCNPGGLQYSGNTADELNKTVLLEHPQHEEEEPQEQDEPPKSEKKAKKDDKEDEADDTEYGDDKKGDQKEPERKKSQRIKDKQKAEKAGKTEKTDARSKRASSRSTKRDKKGEDDE